jgi:hypothetical protein
MSTKAYVTGLMTLIMSIWFVPDWSEFFKVYVISTVAVTTVLMYALFHIRQIREMIVKAVVDDALHQILNDRDVQKLIDTRLHRTEFRQRIEELRKERDEEHGSRS